jgi:hypothetical protein
MDKRRRLARNGRCQDLKDELKTREIFPVVQDQSRNEAVNFRELEMVPSLGCCDRTWEQQTGRSRRGRQRLRLTISRDA